GALLVAAAALAPAPPAGAKTPAIFTPRIQAQALAAARAIPESEVDAEIEAFIRLMEANLVYRDFGMKLFVQLEHEIAVNRAASRPALHQRTKHAILQHVRDFLDVREALWRIVERYEPYAHARLRPADLDLLDQKKLALGLAAAYMLYDNYFTMVMGYEELPELYAFLNQGDPSNGIPAGVLEEISLNARVWHNRIPTATATVLYLRSTNPHAQRVGDPLLDYLHGIIAASPSFDLFRKRMLDRMFELSAHRLDRNTKMVSGDLREAQRNFMNALSGFFGNSVGLIESRKGKLYARPEIASHIRRQLEPLDVLLEKTPFRLTDTFIPGHWGHVAIWVGTREDLERAGIWQALQWEQDWLNLDSGKRERIERALVGDRVILEALRPGVQLNSLEHFMNIDDFVAIRPVHLDADREKAIERKARTLARAFVHFEKDYDFNFDVASYDKIVCSELAYWVYTDVDWPSSRTLGRYSISPDHVIDKALDGREFRAFLLYHDGAHVPLAAESVIPYRRELELLARFSTLAPSEAQRQAFALERMSGRPISHGAHTQQAPAGSRPAN
ncbi:MAG: YiiX/YebB-like N1pC/P60 family cysteine hydrolase, partial [Gammaproteobacteria bacterium]|nr:YiiX/YebB-like N1pC/P60 family cysteine hydrolase [Gammaproteobacteria bacterium]